MTIKTIAGTYASGYTLLASYSGLTITATGRLGGAAGASAGAAGGAALTLPNLAAPVANLGTIIGGLGGAGGAGGVGIYLQAGGGIANSAAISGGAGGAGASGVNIGGVGASGGAAVALKAGGTLTNLAGAIVGGAGGTGGTGLTGGGTGGVGGVGVALLAGGTLVNGATIVGGAGGAGGAGGLGPNGAAGSAGAGVRLLAGGAVVNGSASVQAADISGSVGVYAGPAGAVRVTNFGMIEGTSASVMFASAADRLIAEAGSAFAGAVEGGGGTLELAGGAGTISGLGAAGTLSGAVAMTFGGFGAYVIDSGATWTLAGAGSLAAGQSLANGGGLTVAGTLTTLGAITGGAIDVAAGGALVNGAPATSGATIATTSGVVLHGAASLTNYGTISGSAGYSVKLTSAAGRLAVVNYSVFVGAVNGGGGTLELTGGYGTISGLGSAAATLSGSGSMTFANFGTYLMDPGQILWLEGTDILKAGRQLIGIPNLLVPGTLTNLGTIADLPGAPLRSQVDLLAGGRLTNGGPGNHTALLEAYYGVRTYPNAGITVTNFGTIEEGGQALTGASVDIASGDRLIAEAGSVFIGAVHSSGGTLELAGGAETITGLGGASGQLTGAIAMSLSGFGAYVLDHAASLTLAAGCGLAASQQLTNNGTLTDVGGLTLAGTLINNGAIASGGGGVTLSAGGRLINGSAAATGARLTGQAGKAAVATAGLVSVTNFGTIAGAGAGSTGVALAGGGALVNGSAASHVALISGATGLYGGAGGALTVTNFGSIAGSGGIAVRFKSAADRLIAEAGSQVVGQALGGGGTLELAGGAGTITGAGATASLSGAVAMTFSGFGAVAIDAAANWTLAGTETLGAAQKLISAGALGLTGTLTGAGTLSITGGTVGLNAGAALSIAKVAQSGTSTATLNTTALSYGGAWAQSDGTISAPADDTLTFTGAGNSFGGTLAGAGTIVLAGGTDRLQGAAIKVAHLTIAAATVTLTGTIVHYYSDVISVDSGHLTVVGVGATLTGGGRLTLSNATTNLITGASASTVLSLGTETIQGAGDIGGGQMRLFISAGAQIFGNVSNALILDTGANTIINQGTITANAGGGVEIRSVLANSNLIFAAHGTLTLDKAVTGTGSARINGGTLFAKAKFSQATAFTGPGGALKLAYSNLYGGQISGFATTDAFDLTDIAFAVGTTSVSYKDNGANTGGVLTVTDGTHTAHLHLTGAYAKAVFGVSSDGGTGTKVVEVSAGPAAPFVQAMAGFAPGAGPSAAATAAAASAAVHAPLIASPHGLW